MPDEIPKEVTVECHKLLLKFIWRRKETGIAKRTLKNNKFGRLPVFKALL